MKIKADKQITDPPNNNKNFQWQREMHEDYKGKPRKPGQVLPEGTFTKEPSEISRLLKMHSTDYKSAMSKLNSYINRQGRNLQGADKNRLYDAKEALRGQYGIQEPEATSSTAFPMYQTPDGHNLDDAILDVGLFHSSDDRPRTKEEITVNSFTSQALARLQASQSKASQGPTTAVPELEIDSSNGPSTVPAIEDSFEESHSLSNSEFETGFQTKAAVRVLGEKWSKEVIDNDDHSAVPEGTFTKSADHIAKTLKKVSDSHGQASSRLAFYRNRAGKNLSSEDNKKLESAQEKLKNLYGK